MEFLFCIDGYKLSVLAKDFTLCSIYHSNQPLSKNTALHKLISIVENLRIKSSKNFLRNHAVPGLFFKNCSGDEVDVSVNYNFLWKISFIIRISNQVL